MSNQIYSFFVNGFAVTFYDNYVEQKSDGFETLLFYANHERAMVNGKKLLLIETTGGKSSISFSGNNIRYMDQICEQINSAIQKSKQNNDLARKKTEKDPEYKFSCGKYDVSVYENYGVIVDGKGRANEFLFDDVISTFVSDAMGIITGDVVLRVKPKEKISFTFKKADEKKVECAIKYIIEQIIKIKTGKYGVSEPEETPIYPKDEPKVKSEPQTKAPEKEQKPVEPTVSTTPNFQPSIRRASEGSNVKTADILKLKELYDLGAITEEEFTQKKRQLLGL